MGKSIAVFSSKGGVGKSTFLVNLAGMFEHFKKRVLILDFDLFSGDIDTLLNLNSRKTIYNLLNDINNKSIKDFNNYVTKYSPYIDVIASSNKKYAFHDKNIDLIISRAENTYDIVLIDLNHDINPINLGIIKRAKETLFIVINDTMNIKNSINVLKLPELNKVKIILNNSRDPQKKYYSLYDIRSYLKRNIDYQISSDFYLNNIEKYVVRGKIAINNPSLKNKIPKVINSFSKIAEDLIK